MNSVLNPEAPEFHPYMNKVVQDGYLRTNKTIRTANTFPIGNSYELFKTFTDFNIVSCKLSENVVTQSNQIMLTELPAVKLKCNDDENNTEKIIDANDSLLDRININIDTVSGINQPNATFLAGVRSAAVAAWNAKPIIATIKVGSATFIGAKNIPRPQISFKDTIDNSESLWVPKISDKPNNIKPLALNILYNEEGEAVGYEHPYQVELELYEPPADLLAVDEEPAFPPPLDATPLAFVDTEAKLDALVKHLEQVREIAVDLEHHSYRTYQGITCLIQISTDEGGDYIVDALAIREHIHKLNQSFTDPKKVKIFHGAESDVVWLQRDFGVYVVGLFDTHQAARQLHLAGLSLKYLLQRYCQVNADKKYQLADWRMRPLPAELVEYARMDTHYLLYIWRSLRRELTTQQLLAAFENSRQIAGTTYNKTVTHSESHMPLYVRSKKSFNSQQMAALKMLFRWRDQQARELDESTTYLLPNHMLMALAETLPREVQGVNAVCSPMPPFVKQNLIAIHRMILSCRELPAEPQLYQMPSSVAAMMNAPHLTLPQYNVHDLMHFPEFSEESINLDLAYSFVEAAPTTAPDVTAFAPAAAGAADFAPDLTYLSYGVGSALNADAQWFVPPYDRYRAYRSLAQAEELREFREKEARVAAISKGNQLIREEVLQHLQRAQATIQSEPKVEPAARDPASAPAADTPAPHAADDASTEPNNVPDTVENNDDRHNKKKASQRKRKIIEKTEQKDTPEQSLENKKKDKNMNKDDPNAKPVFYKNVNYKKFYSDTDKGHKQPKMKFKKS